MSEAEQGAGLSLEARRALLKALLAKKEARSAPLSPGQWTIWLLQQLDPGGSAQNFPAALRILSRIDVGALRSSLQALVDRHEILRTTYGLDGGYPTQRIHERQEFCLDVVDAEGWEEAELRRRVTEEVYRPLDLERGPVFRGTLFRQAEENHVLALAWHHIATDGWSFSVAMWELGQLYRGLTYGEKVALPAVPQYRDFVAWQLQQAETPERRRQKDFWRGALSADLPRLDFPTDRPRAAQRDFAAGAVGFSIDDETAAQVRHLAREWGVTPFNILLAAFQALLQRYTGQEVIAVQTPTTGRSTPFAGTLGFFVNQVILASRVVGGATLRSLAAEAKKRTLEAMAHQEYPLPLLFEHLPPNREPGLSRFSPVAFALQKISSSGQSLFLRKAAGRPDSAEDPTFELGGLRVEGFPLEARAIGFDLDVEMYDVVGRLSGGIVFNRGLFDEETVRRLAERFCTLLAGAVSEPDKALSAIPLLSPVEETLIASWSATERAYSQDEGFISLFDAQVRSSPNATAVISQDRSLTFQELDAQARRLASRLATKGVGEGSLVGICLPRSIEAVAAVLAVLRLGAVYAPVDPQHPSRRIARIVAEAEITVVVTLAGLRERLPPRVETILLDADTDREPLPTLEREAPRSQSDSLLYVLYTSGSTGEPKGVMGVHGGVLNRLRWMWEAYPWAEPDVACLTAGLTFVDSVASIFGPLLQGVPLVIVDAEQLVDADRLIETLRTNRVSRITVVPSLLRHLLYAAEPLGERIPSLRLCVCSGEVLQSALARRFLEEVPRATLLNLYGCSEASGDSCFYDMRAGWEGWRVPIGRPIANTVVHILDEGGRRTPIGLPGEIYLGGAGLARGYLARPEENRARFVDSPPGVSVGAPLFRTGDRGRYLPDGAIEYLGRADRQIQIRGQRTEPGEIEAALCENSAVGQAAVKAVPGANGDPILAAFVALRPGAEAGPEDLRRFVEERLPPAMTLSAVVLLDDLPLTATGKIDYARLPESVDETREPYAAPRTPLEEVIAAVWSDALGCDALGIHDHFFDRGGHSLVATRAVSKLSETLRAAVPVGLIFEAPTVGRFAAALLASPQGPAIERAAALVLAVANLSEEEIQERLLERSTLESPPRDR
jgi:amino acid adenylation domain-containing protein